MFRISREGMRLGGKLAPGCWVLGLLLHLPAAAADTPPDSSDAQSLDEVVVTARKLSAARNGIETQVGASTYTFTSNAIDATPGGNDTALNEVILQAPGVAQDSFGQLHVRGEHNGLQYRLNGIILPEGISVFSQSLSPRLADSISLITGALPAEFGLRTAGIIDLKTKEGGFDQGGEIGLYGGSHGQIEPSVEYGGSAGGLSYFVSANFNENGLGIESPDGRSTPIHDQTQQGQGFAYLSDILDTSSRITLILGVARSQFQIPDTAGLPTPNPPLVSLPNLSYPSAALNENQRELTQYGVLSYLRTDGPLDVQISLFGRYSSLYFEPDVTGDLIYTGVAETAYKRDVAGGVQSEAVYRLDPDHTLRGGVIVEGDRATSNTLSLVEVLDASGNPQAPVVPITDTSGKTAWQYSAYLQDEWALAPRLTVNYGLRFDLVDAYTHEHQLSPRLNLVWRATDTTTLHAGYARYFTPPPFELAGGETIAKFANTTYAPLSPGASTPRAERANYLDVGVEQRVLDAITVGLDTYYKNSRDLIDEGQFGAPIILTPFNYAAGRQYGAELSLTWRDGPWSAYGNFAAGVAEGKDIVSNQFNFAPADLAYIADHYIHLDHDQTFTASGGVAYRWRGATFAFDLIHGAGLRADSDHPNGNSLPDYTQINLGISDGFDIPGAGSFKARLDVINLFDTIYQIRNGTGVGVGAPQFGPRRGIFAGLSKIF